MKGEKEVKRERVKYNTRSSKRLERRVGDHEVKMGREDPLDSDALDVEDCGVGAAAVEAEYCWFCHD